MNHTLRTHRRTLIALGFLTLFGVDAALAEGPREAPSHQPEKELRAAVQAIADDAMSANIEGLQAIHLNSEKFSKFGPRSFDRQDVESTNESEAAFFSSVTDMVYEVRDLKIDVFNEVGVVTYYPHVSFVKDGEKREVQGRQTLVFLRTSEGWKIAHEHGTIRQ